MRAVLAFDETSAKSMDRVGNGFQRMRGHAGVRGGGSKPKYQTLTEARDAVRAAQKTGTLKSGEAVTVEVGADAY